MTYVTCYHHNTILSKIAVEEQSKPMTFLDIIQSEGVTSFEAPCGGNGTCGKCRIIIRSGAVSDPSEQEKLLLTPREIDSGIRLACQTAPLGDTEIELSAQDYHPGAISSSGKTREILENAHLRFTSLPADKIQEASLDDQRSILSRITASGPQAKEPLRIAQSLLEQLYAADSHTDIILQEGSPYLLLPRGSQVYGVAVDIGTTTLVLYLLNLLTGEQIATSSAMNAQKQYGADVISRIAFASKSAENRKKAAATIADQIETMLLSLLKQHGIDPEQVPLISVAGNTTMLHLLAGIHTEGIAAAPFIPVFTEMLAFSAAELGMKRLPRATVELLPSVAAYVGADITAGIHTSGITEGEAPRLLLDIGTNGEIALATDGQILCCSTAAGPAFEGANISCGTGGVPGAIDTVIITPEGVDYTTIADGKPVGICGSGIIALAAQLVTSGLVDYTGRLLSPEEKGHPCLVTRNGENVFLVATDDQSSTGSEMYLTQKDIREIQLAKAAIAGGIRTLLDEAGIVEEDVEQLCIAGGFGSYIAPKQAGLLGLIPRQLVNKSIAVGNSSGEGSILSTLWIEHREDILQIARQCRYIELSAHKTFQEYYIEEMFFDAEV
ncbi:MAG: ASKHA domain-containing protein [Spirochaetota bacterium]